MGRRNYRTFVLMLCCATALAACVVDAAVVVAFERTETTTDVDGRAGTKPRGAFKMS